MKMKMRPDPPAGGPNIFETDPLISTAWRGDWNLTTVLQDEAGGTSTGGTLYLTNIHRRHVQTAQEGERRSHCTIGGCSHV